MTNFEKLQGLNEENVALAQRVKEIEELLIDHDKLLRELRESKWRLRELEREIPIVERLVSEEEQKKQLEDALLRKSAELDALTASAKWREFAFEHQIEGAKVLTLAERGILGDKRGLGKTLTSLIWLHMAGVNRVLVLTKNDLVDEYVSEIRKWTDGWTVVNLANEHKTMRNLIYPTLKLLDKYIVVLNYEAWRKDKNVIRHLKQQGFQAVIWDEAHILKEFKNVTTRGAVSIVRDKNKCPEHGYDEYFDEKICPLCSKTLECSVQYYLAMTGTPILNKPQELFTMLHCVDAERYSSLNTFLRMYCQRINGRWRFKPGGLSSLIKKMSHFFLQRTREDAGIKIPPPSITYHQLDFSDHPMQAEAYKTLSSTAELVLSSGESFPIPYLLTIMLRQRQMTVWPAGIEFKDPEDGKVLARFDVAESVKIDKAVEIISELVEEGERVVVFSNFNEPVRELSYRLNMLDISNVQYTGDTSPLIREAIKRDFDQTNPPENPRWKVVITNYKVAGEGLNLGAATNMVMLDQEWNAGREDQAIGRIDRLNSTTQANVHILQVQGTVDTFVERLVKEKGALVNAFESSATLAAEMLKAIRNGTL